MLPRELFRLFTGPLEALGVPYFVTGSVASLIYGEPRLTHDIDLVLTLGDADVARFEAVFPADDFYLPPEEILRVEARRRAHGHFNIIHHATGFKADVYLSGTSELHAWAFGQRRRTGADEAAFWIAPPEYVIVRKLEYFREGGSEKHLRDVRAMRDALGEAGLDRAELDRWIARLALESIWALVEKR